MTTAATEPHDDSLPPIDDGRDESRAERLDRNTIELINELRVAGTARGSWPSV